MVICSIIYTRVQKRYQTNKRSNCIQLQVVSMLLRLLPKEPRQCSELTGRADIGFLLPLSAKLLKYAKHKQLVWHRTLHVPVPKRNVCFQMLTGHIKACSPKKGNWLVATWRRSLRGIGRSMVRPPFPWILRTKMQLLRGDAVTELGESTWRRLGVGTKFVYQPNEAFCSCAGWKRKKAMVNQC